jgi:predicted rRNA methylase YqxC with S4 and FtsJ domains
MEADRGRGIIRDQSIQQRVLKEISAFANDSLIDSELYAQTESNPRGTDGNLEYFLAWKKSE